MEIHGHRGARGLWPENTLPGLARALELGVHALEFDVAMSADGRLVLTHDLTVSAVTSADTAPAVPEDPLFPYVGRPIKELSLARLRTLEVGVRLPRRPDDPFALTQTPVPGTRMPTLSAVLGLMDAYGADTRLHVELKSDPTRPDLSADPEEFTTRVVAELDRHGRLGGAALLSFDWRILRAAHRLAPQVPRFALVERETWHAAWFGLDPAEFGHDLAACARAAQATVLSPDRVLVDEALAAAAARAGLPVVVWTVNEVAEAARMIDLGMAGVVTDYPDRMRGLWAERGLPLPAPVRWPAGRA